MVRQALVDALSQCFFIKAQVAHHAGADTLAVEELEQLRHVVDRDGRFGPLIPVKLLELLVIEVKLEIQRLKDSAGKRVPAQLRAGFPRILRQTGDHAVHRVIGLLELLRRDMARVLRRGREHGPMPAEGIVPALRAERLTVVEQDHFRLCHAKDSS